jgi:hypothetical protein
MNSNFSAENLPSIVGELRGFTVEIHCRRCGRHAVLDPVQMSTSAGRAIARSMPLPKFLAALTCTEKACGEKPINLHLKTRLPSSPGSPPGPMLTWMMDRFGRWQWLGESTED